MANYLRSRSPVFSITTDHQDAKADQARIKASKKIQKAIAKRESWHSMLSVLAVEPTTRSSTGVTLIPDNATKPGHLSSRQRHPTTVRIIRRLTGKPLDNTLEVADATQLTNRERRRMAKLEKKRLNELERFEREQWALRVAQAREEREREHQSDNQYVRPQHRLRHAVKDGLLKTKTLALSIRPRRSRSKTRPALPTIVVPHVHDFENKEDLQAYMAPQPTTIIEDMVERPTLNPPGMAELEATVPEHATVSVKSTRNYLDDHCKAYDFMPSPSPSPSPTPPPPSASPFPRWKSLSPSLNPFKQMRCDYCHDPIKMTEFHYQCSECDSGERMYCSRCVEHSTTCRHDLIENKRQIRRHQSNPVQVESRPVAIGSSLDDLQPKPQPSTTHVEVHGNRGRILPLFKVPSDPIQASTEQTLCQGEEAVTHDATLHVFETKQREQEISFREKEIALREAVLREQQALLREREILAQSREREATLMQQIQTTALIHERERAAEIGSQFSPVSPISRRSTYRRSWRPSTPPSITTKRSVIILDSPVKSEFQNTGLAQLIASTEASISGINTTHGHYREHANNKRKASGDAPSGSRGSSVNQALSVPPHGHRSGSAGGDNSDDGDKGGASPKRIKQESPGIASQRLFACPYCKFDANRYSERNQEEMNYRGCAKGVFRDMSRVKQHLKRVHHCPDHFCPRCFIVFEDEQSVSRHITQEIACSPCPCPYSEKLDQDQQVKVHVKRPGMGAEKLWYLIYEILFPGADLPASPYVEHNVPPSRVTNFQTAQMFIEILENRLDSHEHFGEQEWLARSEARLFLRSQLASSMEELLQRMAPLSTASPATLPSVLVSPVSPSAAQQFLTAPQSPGSSIPTSPNQKRRLSSNSSPLLSPEQTKLPRRPILKVSTSALPQPAPSSTTTPITSTTSATSNVRFDLNIPTHVTEDVGYGDNGCSWRSGDDKDKMVEEVSQSLVRPVDNRHERRVSFERPRPVGKKMRNLKPNYSPVDSGYGTQSSRNSLQSNSRQPSIQESEYKAYQNGNITCIDPRLTVMAPGQSTTTPAHEFSDTDIIMGGNVLEDSGNHWKMEY